MASPYFYNTCWMLTCFKEAQAYRRASRLVRQTQAEVLQEIVTRNRETQFGKRHRFSSLQNSPLQNIKAFQRAVPISTYEDYAESIERIARGEARVLTAEPVELLEPTSGTTSGEKLIPYTASLKRSFQRAIRAWIWDLFSNRPAVRKGFAYWSISPLGNIGRTTAAGIPIGFDDDAGYLGDYEKRLLAKTLAVPPSIALCPNVPSAQYTTLFFLLRCPQLSLMSVWSPTFLQELLSCLQTNWQQLCKDIEQGSPTFGPTQNLPSALSGSFQPQPQRALRLWKIMNRPTWEVDWVSQIWPQLSMVSCWADGPSKKYAEDLRRNLPGIDIQPKGLLATEAFVSFPLLAHPGSSLAIRSHFFEFLPVDSSGQFQDKETKLADELQQGKHYQVIVTTAGGLYRYQMKDQVEVVGFSEQTPQIRFVGKCDATSDLVGEKLNEAHVQTVLERALDAHHLSPTYFELVAQAHPAPCYLLRIADEGLARDKAKQASLCKKIDAALKSNPGYRYARELGQLGDLQLIHLSPKEAETLKSERTRNLIQLGIRHGNIKTSVLSPSTNPPPP